MPQGQVPLRASADHRHVPAHAPHRIRRLFLAAFLTLFSASFVEANDGLVAEVTKDTELLQAPRDGARSHGRLPSGTLLRITGELDGGYYPVDVELEQGSLEGWIRKDHLNLDEQKREADAESKWREAKKKAEQRSDKYIRPKRGRVPKDESLLLRRNPSFFYGIHGGGGYSIVHCSVDGSVWTGLAAGGGGHVGFFADKDIPLRIEVGYTQVMVTDGTTPGSFGFLDAGMSAAYHIDNLELFGKIHVAFGMSVSTFGSTDIDTSFDTAFSLTSPWLSLGLGYRLPISEITSITARAFYSISFLRSPFAFQNFGGMLYLDFRG